MARFGGDEFTMLAKDMTYSLAEAITARLQENLRSYNAQRRHSYKLVLSLGVLRADPDTAKAIEQLVAQADQLMYLHKRGKKQPHFSTGHADLPGKREYERAEADALLASLEHNGQPVC